MLSFVLNSYFNFKVKDRLLKRALSFYTIGYIGLLISTGILFVGLHIFEIPEMTVKIVSIFIVATIQFILNKTITFKKVK
jgi:putative flippase GtrA